MAKRFTVGDINEFPNTMFRAALRAIESESTLETNCDCGAVTTGNPHQVHCTTNRRDE
jgi:hypothetical protein